MSAQSLKKSAKSKGSLGLFRKIGFLGLAEFLFIFLLIISGLLIAFTAAKQLKEGKEASLEQIIKGKEGPGGSIAKVGVHKKEEKKEASPTAESVEEKETEKDESTAAEKAEEAAAKKATTGEPSERSDKKGKALFEESEEEAPPEFYRRQKEEEELGPKIGRIGEPLVETLPAEKVGFSLQPLPKRVYQPKLSVAGRKSAFTSVWLSKLRIVPGDGKTEWSYNLELNEGKNELVFSSKDIYENKIAEVKMEIFYEPTPVEKPEIASLVGGPLASLSPTFFATPSAEAAANPRLAPLLEPAKKPRRETAHSSGSPKIYSPTHPNQNRWYRDRSPKLVWEKNTFWPRYFVSLSHLPIDPSEDLGGQTKISYQNLEDGVWYFGVKALTAEGEATPANFYRILIDNTPPKITSLKITDPYPVYKNGSLVNLRIEWEDDIFDSPFKEIEAPFTIPLSFLSAGERKALASHIEDLSPLRRYLEVDFSPIDSNFSREQLTVSAPVKLAENRFAANVSYRVSFENPRDDEGGIPILAKIQDYAGNSAMEEIGVTLANNVLVALTPEEAVVKKPLLAERVATEGLRLSGTTVPNVEVTLYIYSEPIVATVRSDLSGRWEYTVRQPLPPGNHAIYAKAADRQGNATPVVQIGSITVVNSAQAAEINRIVETVAKIPSQESFASRAAAKEAEAKELSPPSEDFTGKLLSAQLMMIAGLLLFFAGVVSLVLFLRKKPT